MRSLRPKGITRATVGNTRIIQSTRKVECQKFKVSGNTFLVPGATVATLLILGALHACRQRLKRHERKALNLSSNLMLR
ncbi:hypothetical protein EZV62_012420 [Acer yangbiense]|uniref:Uncharacterized protein n=1 Tax=Acer yangbiense TaxID=1000413 RepID=A0A5C7HVB8_9ROSI|nr:hypothetical protein EZV62_012420 [Acer yangbiense]